MTMVVDLIGCSGLISSFTSTSRSGAAVLAELETLPLGMDVIHLPSEMRLPVGPNSEGWLATAHENPAVSLDDQGPFAGQDT